MKVRVNLAGRRKQVTRTKEVVVKGFWIFFGTFVLAFLSYFGFALYKTFSLRSQISQVNAQAVLISNQIRQNNEVVNQFVLAKGILDQVETVNASKFSYKRYMDEIVAILPAGAALRNVDFQNKGWVSVSVFAPDVTTLKDTEERIADQTIIDQTVFSSIFSEETTRDKNGGFVIKMQFEIKKNG